MRVLLVHNYYQLPGGEDAVFRRERALLIEHGHEVREYTRSNDQIVQQSSMLTRIHLAADTLWSRATEKELAALAAEFRPEVTHFHNTFPLISPSAYQAVRAAGSAVVQSLHNPRLLCPAATLMRKGKTCEDCSSKLVPWPAVLHRCYQDSMQASLVSAGYLAFHKVKRTWKEDVDRFITFTDFYTERFATHGVPRGKIMMKPHFCQDFGEGAHDSGYALYVGRLAEEKGLGLLLDAWEQAPAGASLKVRGSGPLAARVQAVAARTGSVTLLARSARTPGCVQGLDLEAAEAEQASVIGLMKGAAFFIWPSLGLYETFGCVAIEAFSCGLPVIAARAGVMAEMVEDGVTGLLFESGNADDLARKVRWAHEHPEQMRVMGRRARQVYLERFTAEGNYRQLMEIYSQATAAAKDARLSRAAVHAPTGLQPHRINE